MLFDALDSYLTSKNQQKKLMDQMSASPQERAKLDEQFRNVSATADQNFLQHLGTTLGARMLGNTGLSALGVGQDNQALQNALAYQQRPNMLQGSQMQDLSGSINVPNDPNDQSNLRKMMNLYMSMQGS